MGSRHRCAEKPGVLAGFLGGSGTTCCRQRHLVISTEGGGRKVDADVKRGSNRFGDAGAIHLLRPVADVFAGRGAGPGGFEALRPRPRQPRPTRSPLSHRIRRRRLTGPAPPASTPPSLTHCSQCASAMRPAGPKERLPPPRRRPESQQWAWRPCRAGWSCAALQRSVLSARLDMCQPQIHA